MPGIRCQICSWEVCGEGGGGSYIGRGFAKGGGVRTPLVTGLYLSVCYVNISVSITACNVLHIRT